MALLVVASILPLIGMGLVREALDYRADRQSINDGLLRTVRGVAVGVENDLQLRISSLETLAVSPVLTSEDGTGFDQQAAAFLSRQPPGSLLGLVTPDFRLRRIYGISGKPLDDMSAAEISAKVAQVFATGVPAVTDMHMGWLTGDMCFSVVVPVERDGRVVDVLFLGLRSSALAGLVARQYAPQGAVLTVADASGHVVVRIPSAARVVGSSVVPALWSAIRDGSEGLVPAANLQGTTSIAAYAHVAPFDWTVMVSAPRELILAPIRLAIIHISVVGSIILALGLALAMFAARGITRPIEQLGRLATGNDRISDASVRTGLPEADTVARALGVAATYRHEAAKALAESESRFRALFEKSASGTILLDPETTQVIDSNDVAAAIVGCTVEEFRTHRITDFARQVSPERIHEFCRRVAAGGCDTLRFETRIQGRNGLRDVLNAIAPIQVAGRSLILINQIDITELRSAEAGLLVNEERLELARQGASLGIWDWDIVNDTLSWSEHQWFLHGLDRRPEGPSLRLWRQVVHPDDVARAQQEVLAALKLHGQPFATEYSVILPDGTIRRLLARGQTIRGADGRAVRMVGINMDVTARHEAEMARDRLIWMLETERGRLTEIIEALPVGVGIVNTSGQVILGNSMMKRVDGPILDAMTLSPGSEWIAQDTEGNALRPENFPIRRALESGETTLPGVEFLFRDSDGSEKWYRVGSIPLRWDNGQVQEALGIFLDIDAEKRLLDIQHQITARLEQRVLEEISAREAAQKRAAHAERMHALGQIAGGIAHDFNNVLQAVSGSAALIERRPEDTARVLRHARTLLDAARRGAAITSRLLAFSRRGDLRAENVDAAALLADMAEILTHTLGGSVVCVVNANTGLPPLFADRGQLETVLVNLATNARDAMPSGGTLTLSAQAETVSAGLPHPAGLVPGLYVRIEVSDTGTGMGRAVLARVTEPFFTTKEPGKGTGLGLAMAKGFVEQSGGSLSIDSIVGKGTCVILWLPVEPSAGGAAPRQPPVRQGAVRKPCVLLVDDDAIVSDVLKLSLEDAGYAVQAIKAGAAALSWMDNGGRPDIIVSDLTMPEMDGLTLIPMVQERRPNLPAILLTGYAGDDAALAVGGAISGAFSLLRKPVSGTQLVDRIAALLASRKQPSKV